MAFLPTRQANDAVPFSAFLPANTAIISSPLSSALSQSERRASAPASPISAVTRRTPPICFASFIRSAVFDAAISASKDDISRSFSLSSAERAAARDANS